jgi:hypothetical protein
LRTVSRSAAGLLISRPQASDDSAHGRSQSSFIPAVLKNPTGFGGGPLKRFRRGLRTVVKADMESPFWRDFVPGSAGYKISCHRKLARKCDQQYEPALFG